MKAHTDSTTRGRSVYLFISFFDPRYIFVASSGIQQLLGISPSHLCSTCPDPALTLKTSGKSFSQAILEPSHVKDKASNMFLSL